MLLNMFSINKVHLKIPFESLCVNNCISLSLVNSWRASGTTQQEFKLIWTIVGLI